MFIFTNKVADYSTYYSIDSYKDHRKLYDKKSIIKVLRFMESKETYIVLFNFIFIKVNYNKDTFKGEKL